MGKQVEKIVWDIFIEESMGCEKVETYKDRILDYSEDMCYMTYHNLIKEIQNGNTLDNIKFEDILPDDLQLWK